MLQNNSKMLPTAMLKTAESGFEIDPVVGDLVLHQDSVLGVRDLGCQIDAESDSRRCGQDQVWLSTSFSLLVSANQRWSRITPVRHGRVECVEVPAVAEILCAVLYILVDRNRCGLRP